MPCAKQYSERAGACQPPLRRWVDRSRRWLARTLWPSSCILCGGGGDVGIDLCRDCAADLPRNETACERCAEPLPASCAPQVCGACLRDPPPFDELFRAVPLCVSARSTGPRPEVPRRARLGRVLGQLFARMLAGAWRTVAGRDRAGAARAAPLSRARLQPGQRAGARDCDASPASRSRPMLRSASARLREQAGLDRKSRRRNVSDAFAAVAPLRARHVAIVDDVVTTGSTVHELAEVAAAGADAEQVDVWAVAANGAATA